MITTSVIKNVIPLSRLIDFCTTDEAGDLNCSNLLFNQIEEPSLYIWNSMIKGYSNSNNPDEALHMYREMQQRDIAAGLEVFDFIPKWNVVAWTCLIDGYVNNGWPKTGKWVHSRVHQLGYDPFESDFDFNVILATAIIDMYAKCGSLRYARNLFNKMPQKNLVAWNSMIGACNQYGRFEEALVLFFDLLIGGFQPDTATFLSVIGSCAHLGALALGQSIHGCLLKTNISEDIAIGTALVDMYAKTGDATSSQQIFCKLQKKDVMAWTSMITGFAMRGHGEEALSTFKRMQEDATVVPDEITYIGVLCACSHLGMIEEGQRHFNSMADVYGIEPRVEHYGCMVDLLSRAGHFEEAERLVKKMPIEPNIAIWGALLNGCKIHENVNLADQVRRRITELEPQGSGVYVLLSNIYAGVGKWQEVKLARELMAQRRISKTWGHSAIELRLLSS
ncbi:hypothetical protein CJ030_MR1G027734 [Morella rubra]|uniref:Pentatricopeptide repeat-containing protein n=1 Tax=Morella rubra TaxID=262757 RepID=A0A6A1WTQ8_9ROSI|nr:hypothetical protein CJ030_MR1G027734 [Morella rubra]